MNRLRPVMPYLASLAIAACSGPQKVPSESGKPSSGACGRYQERIDNACAAVEVTGITDRPLSFTRNGYTLHGTLTLPVTRGEYRAPVAVLTHGSGPNDRDETLPGALGVAYGQKIPVFRLLAEDLARAGIAVYRYDKRTCFRENSENRCQNALQAYPGSLDDVRVGDYIADFRAAVRAAAAAPEVDPEDITLIGHSQGANFVPLLMVDEPGVRAGVLLAGASLPIDQIITGQLREFADHLATQGTQFAQTVAGLRAKADAYDTALGQIRAGAFSGASYEGASVAYWRRWIESTDHLREEFVAVDRPMLVLSGTIDFNVAPHHLERFREWSTAAGKTNATFRLLPNVTHGFLPVLNGGRGIDPRFSPEALEAILSWHRGL